MLRKVVACAWIVFARQSALEDRPVDGDVCLLQLRGRTSATHALPEALQEHDHAAPAIPRTLIFASTKPANFPSVDALLEPLRSNVRKNIALNPGFEVEWYDDARCTEYFRKNYADGRRLAEVFAAVARGAHRSDLCRTAVLAKQGGFVVDLDVELVAPLARVAARQTALMTAWSAGGEPGCCAHALLNGFLGAAPGNAVLSAMLNRMEQTAAELSPGQNWGPVMLLDALEETVRRCDGAMPSWTSSTDTSVCGKPTRILKEVHFLDQQSEVPESALPSVLSLARAEHRYSSFDGDRYVLIDPTALGDGAVAGFSRFSECKGWGCGQSNPLALLQLALGRVVRRVASWRAFLPL